MLARLIHFSTTFYITLWATISILLPDARIHILLFLSTTPLLALCIFFFHDENFISNFPVFLRKGKRDQRGREREQHAPYMHSNGNRGKNYVSKRYYYRVVERICFSLASYYSIHKIGPGHFSPFSEKEGGFFSSQTSHLAETA